MLSIFNDIQYWVLGKSINHHMQISKLLRRGLCLHVCVTFLLILDACQFNPNPIWCCIKLKISGNNHQGEYTHSILKAHTYSSPLSSSVPLTSKNHKPMVPYPGPHTSGSQLTCLNWVALQFCRVLISMAFIWNGHFPLKNMAISMEDFESHYWHIPLFRISMYLYCLAAFMQFFYNWGRSKPQWLSKV